MFYILSLGTSYSSSNHNLTQQEIKYKTFIDAHGKQYMTGKSTKWYLENMVDILQTNF